MRPQDDDPKTAMHWALKICVLAHRSMDVPKKVSLPAILCLLNEYMQAGLLQGLGYANFACICVQIFVDNLIEIEINQYLFCYIFCVNVCKRLAPSYCFLFGQPDINIASDCAPVRVLATIPGPTPLPRGPIQTLNLQQLR